MLEDKNKKPLNELEELGEFGLIEHLTKNIQLKNKSSLKGVGDDAAVVYYKDKQTVLTTDLLVEGIHFDLMYSPLKHLGYKAVIVNLSDIYAMNADPTQITVSIAISSKFSVEALDELYKGIREACRIYKVDLVGGDTTSSPKGLTISVTAMGKTSADKITYRSGAKKGDILCVTGDLGSAYLGLQILEREKQLYMSNPGIQPDLENQQYLLERQLKPEARKDSIGYLRKESVVPTAMIDISDGLLADLEHILEASNKCIMSAKKCLSAHIKLDAIPLSSGAKLFIDKTGDWQSILTGGDDYQLCFTLKPEEFEKIKLIAESLGVTLSVIGEIVLSEEDASVGGIKLSLNEGAFDLKESKGYLHF